MTEPQTLDQVPAALPAPRRRWLSISQAIWLIPLAAVLVAGWIAANEWLQRGPTITIELDSGEGVEAGRTRIKYRNVDVGEVTGVGLSPDRHGVMVTARMSRDARELLVEDTRFWVVRPRVSGAEVSGLSTLLSGSYIAMDAGRSKTAWRRFQGLDSAPVVSVDEPGRQFVLHGSSLGSLEVGSAVYFRRVRVGQVLSSQLEPDGRGVQVRVFVRAPNDRYVTPDTRFWHASGVDVSVGATGVRLRTESLLSVLVGGVAFGTPPQTSTASVQPAEPDAHFTLFDGQQAAMRRSGSQIMTYTATFVDSVRGLAAGAPVEFKGFPIGEVASVDVDWDAQQRRLVFPVRLHIYRDIAGAGLEGGEAGADSTAAPSARASGAAVPQRRFQVERLLSPRAIESGLRAQLRTANLLTGQRYVALDFLPRQAQSSTQAALAQLEAQEIPTVPDPIGEVPASLARIARQLEALPLQEIAADLRRTLASVDAAVRATEETMRSVRTDVVPGARETLEETRVAMQEARAAMQQVQGLVAPDAPATQELRAALRDLSRAAEAMRQLADTIERHPESLLRGRRAAPPLPSPP